MKKLFIILSFLIAALNSFSQNVQSNNSFIFQPTTNPVTTFRIKGIFSSDSAIYLPIRENNWTPTRSGAIQFAPTQSAPYYYNMDSAKWLPFGSGGGSSPPSLATLSPGFGLIGVTYNPYSTNQTWLVDTSKLLTINNFLTNYFDTSSGTTTTFFNVVSINNTPPVSPLDSSYYLVGTAPTGIWITHENQVAQRLGTGWAYTTPEISQTLTDISTQTIYIWNGTDWVKQPFAILGQLNPQDVDLRIGSIPNKALNFYTDSTYRFGISNGGDLNYYRWDADTSTAYTLGVIYKNGKFDTVHARDLILTTTGSSGAATLINNVLNIPQYSGGGGGGTVTDFSAGNLSPLFTSSVATSTSTPALTFAQSNTTQFTVLGRISSGSGTYSFVTADSTLIQGLHSEAYYNTKYGTGNGTVTNVSSADANATVATQTTTPVITIVSAPKLQTARTIGTTTGDATSAGSTFDGTANNTNALTLATVNSNVGSFGDATHVGAFTVNGKGLVTAASSVAITGFASSTLTDTHLFVGNGSNVATDVAASGDLTLANTGAFTIANLAVTNAKIANSTIDLTTKVTGVLPIANGGTNNGSLSVTNGNLLYTDGSKVVGLGVGTAKQHLLGGTIPHWADTATGGGSGITKAYLPLVVSSGGDSISQRFNVMAYGAVGDGVTDDAAAIQAAINACAANGGGVVWFPKNTYRIGNAINGTFNVQLYIPVNTGTSRYNIILRGEAAPNSAPVGGALPGSTLQAFTGGSILKSTITTGASGSAVIGQTLTTYVNLTVENLAISVKNNPAGAGPVIGGITWKNGFNPTITNVAVYIDTLLLNSVMPTNDVSGIELPDVAQGEMSSITNCYVAGFKNGIYFGEHANLNGNTILSCYFPFRLKGGGHASWGGRNLIQWSPYCIYADPVTAADLKLDELDVEYITTSVAGSKWYVSRYILNDSTSKLHGTIFYHTDSAGQVGHYNNFTKNGGTNVNTYAIYDSTSFLKLNANSNWITNGGTSNIITLSIGGTNAWSGFYQNSHIGKFLIATNRFSADEFSISDSNTSKQKLQILSNGDVNLGTDIAVAPRITITTATGGVSIGGVTSAGSTTALLIDGSRNININNGGGYWDATNNRLGIGTTGPGNALHIKGTLAIGYLDRSSTGDYAMLKWGTNGSAKYVMGLNQDATGGVDKLTIVDIASASTTSVMTFTGGSIGIRTNSPTARLHLPAGTVTASTAPLKFTTGLVLTTPESGVMETDGNNELFYSNSTTAASRGYVHVDRYVAKTANYTATANDGTINCTANTFQVTLPTAVGIAGRTYTVTNSGAGTITIGTTSSQTFTNVVATPTTLSLAAVGFYTVQSDGANWLVISN